MSPEIVLTLRILGITLSCFDREGAVTFKIEKKGDLATLTLDGNVTIEHVAEIKDLLSQALFEFSKTVVCLDKIERIDLSGIQLFCAANRSFENSNKELSITGKNDSEGIKQALLEAGFDSLQVCPENLCEKCFWKGDFE